MSLWRYARLFRQDLLSAQPDRLYCAWMAEFRTPFFRSYLINQPDLLRLVLRERPMAFPKSDRISAGLRPLLGRSVFLTNGEDWARQRRIIDPAFAAGRLDDVVPAMHAAAAAAVARLDAALGAEPVEVEELASHAAADVIFRTLFSVPIDDRIAARIFRLFRDYQRAQPLLNLAALVPLPRWVPRWLVPGLAGVSGRRSRRMASEIRALIGDLTRARAGQIAAGTAPDDLATKIMTATDPETGEGLSEDEMVDQVAIFFLAGHETSAAALAWSLYLLARAPCWQERVAAGRDRQGAARDVFREALRLYPPVPMMVRETTEPEHFRGRDVPRGAQIVLSPWHLHRHERLWDRPDTFDPARWRCPSNRTSARTAYLPFSAGPRVCPGAGFAMLEGPILLTALVRRFSFAALPDRPPVPEAHLTVRARDGIWLRVRRRGADPLEGPARPPAEV